MTTIINRLIGRPLLLLLALSVVPMAACDDGIDPFSDPEFTVMSRNSYEADRGDETGLRPSDHAAVVATFEVQ